MSKVTMASKACPMEIAINILSGKWNLLIIWHICKSKTIRFNELQRRLGKIITKTLTQQLKALEALSMIKSG